MKLCHSEYLRNCHHIHFYMSFTNKQTKSRKTKTSNTRIDHAVYLKPRVSKQINMPLCENFRLTFKKYIACSCHDLCTFAEFYMFHVVDSRDEAHGRGVRGSHRASHGTYVISRLPIVTFYGRRYKKPCEHQRTHSPLQ